MEHRRAMLDGFRIAWGSGWSLPEIRHIEMYTCKRHDAVLANTGTATCPELAGARHALSLLEVALPHSANCFPDGLSSWDLYRLLPRKTLTERIIAEAFRLLRVLQISLEHPAGEVHLEGNLVRCQSLDKNYPVALGISRIGLNLIQSLVFFYLDAFDRPWGDAYVEAILSAYYTDIVGEIRGFEDEDHALYQYRPPLTINRHFRLACTNPRYMVEDGYCRVELGPIHSDPTRFPLDLYLKIGGTHYIIPVEALTSNAIAMAELARWETRHLESIQAQTPVTETA